MSHFLAKLTLPQRLIAIGAVMGLIVALTAVVFFQRQEHGLLDLRLREKAAFVNNFYSFLIADSLQRKDDVTLLQVVNRLEEDPEITAVIVVDQNGDVRYHADTQKTGTKWDDPLVLNTLKTGDAVASSFVNSGGRALALVSPLKVQGNPQPIGAVRIEFTYRHIENQISRSESGFLFVALGAVTFAVGCLFFMLDRSLLRPLSQLRQAVASLNPMTLDTPLPQTSDEFGEVNMALNDLMAKIRAELQRQQALSLQLGDQEKRWVAQLAQSFLPDARVIIADKDNRVLSDTGNGGGEPRPTSGEPGAEGRHLLDLIKDANFATLLNNAFQQEGDVVRGPVTLQDHSYQAAILSVPFHQTLTVKTLIALRPS